MLGVLSGCGDSNPRQPAASTATPENSTGQSPSAEKNPTVTYCRDVAPIFFRRCVTCHRPGEVGPFSLLTYQDARDRAQQIADITSDRIMPPWSPAPDHGDFQHSRRLDDKELETIQAWVEGGSLEGDSSELPPPPEFTKGWQLGEPDLIVSMDEPFLLPKEGSDVFRNFVLKVPLKRIRDVRAIEIRFDNPSVVHHAIVQFDNTGNARSEDESDPGPGFGGIARSMFYAPEGQLLGWVPGRQPHAGFDDISWPLKPGTDVVLELHMLPTGKEELLRAKIGFFFTKLWPGRSPLMMKLTRYDFEIPAGDASFEVRDEFQLPVDVEVLSVYAHAHYLGKAVQAWAELPDGEKIWLLKIPQWDFFWQDEYIYKTPVVLPRGTKVSMVFSYDNSSENPLNPSTPPRRVGVGWETADEMAEVWLRLVPIHGSDDGPWSDASILAKALQQKDSQAWMDIYRGKLQVNQFDHETRLLLAGIMVQRGAMAEAAEELTTLLDLIKETETDPSKPTLSLESRARALQYLAHAMQSTGRRAESQSVLTKAVSAFQQAIVEEPEDAELRLQLGIVYIMHDNAAPAIKSLAKSTELNPYNPLARYYLATAYSMAGDRDAALREVQESLRLSPDLSDAQQLLERLQRR